MSTELQSTSPKGGDTQQPLLVELLVEELPPKALKRLGEAFASLLADGLKAQGLASADAAVKPFASPRRLAVLVADVRARADDQAQQIKLMPVAVGLDASGQATPALLKRLAAMGQEASQVAQLKRVGAGKAETLFLDTVLPGALLADGLQKALDDAIRQLPIPKVMQYQLEQGSGADFQPGWTSVNFVRPVHALVALHGDSVVPVTALGLQAGRQTLGHRFEALVSPLQIRSASSYEEQLQQQGAVIADFGLRRAELQRQLVDAAVAQGLTVIDDEALLDEVTALVERPKVLLCRFEREFLAVPPECLILTMKANQKYFPLLDSAGQFSAGQLTEKFLIVSNIDPADPSRVVQGNERVVRPRLADAKFFYDQDRKKTLQSRVPLLDKVVYHGKLGSQGQRTQRVVTIASHIGRTLGGSALADQVERAALLAKTDLLTDMVGEFPELQGVMGAYYARHDGESDAVAAAIEDHYKPRFAGDSLPRNEVGLVLALADKLETLAGLFGIGQLPTGDKDPFALRRHALGVLRMLVERGLPLSLPDLLDQAFAAFAAVPGFPAQGGEQRQAAATFVYDRLTGYLREQGFSAHEVDAVVAARPPWAQMMARLSAVRDFAALPEAPALASANKRVGNILKKAEGEVPAAVDEQLLFESAEQALAAALKAAEPVAAAALARGDYTASLQALAVLKQPVDSFFDAVMVNAEDPGLRRNRLALLAGLHRTLNQVADLSRLAS